jgi:seryl-tRNA synthetase
MPWISKHALSEQAAARRRLQLTLDDTRQYATQLATDLVKAIRRADAAADALKAAGADISDAHRELADQLAAVRRDRDSLRRQLDDALGYNPAADCPETPDGEHDWEPRADERRCKKCTRLAPSEQRLAELNRSSS